MKNINHFGTLYIVATPLGHLKDMTYRAVEVLQQVDAIAAEDTRHSQSLLNHYAITNPLFSLHDHNEQERAQQLLEQLLSGKSIALISDAGTPLISDPGYHLVRTVRAAGITVVPIPGPSALIAALSASGLPTDRFVFEGFLPAKKQARQQQLKALQHETRTLIFYEAPHRVLDLLTDLQAVMGPLREAVVARELTKMFETIRAGTLSELTDWVTADRNQQRGEIVVLVRGAEPQPVAQSIAEDGLLIELLKHLPLKAAVDVVVKVTNEKKNAVYERALALKKL